MKNQTSYKIICRWTERTNDYRHECGGEHIYEDGLSKTVADRLAKERNKLAGGLRAKSDVISPFSLSSGNGPGIRRERYEVIESSTPKVKKYPKQTISSSRAQGLTQVILQEWEESERGWGQRPDGVSLHLSMEDLELFIKEYWEMQPDFVPDEYSRPANSSRPRTVYVDKYMHKQIKKSHYGIRLSEGSLEEISNS